jgi:hypothetical protein
MRTFLLCCCLLAGAGTLGAADAFSELTAGQGGANPVPQRKAINTVCPIDGNPVNPQIEPVSMMGANGEYVLVGACSQACRDNLRTKLGDEQTLAVNAAKQNTTIAKIKAATPATPPPATGFQPVPAPTTGQPLPPPPPPVAQTKPGATTQQPTYQPLDQPKPLAAPEKTTSEKQTKSSKSSKSDKSDTSDTADKGDTTSEKHAHKSDHHASKEPVSTERGDQSDERQREKKAAQRRDRGESTEEPTTGHTSSKKHKKPSKPEEEPPAENDTTMPASAPVLGGQ